MNTINHFSCVILMATVLVVSGCTNLSASRPLTVPGVNSSSVTLLENDEGRTAVLVGKVDRVIDRRAVEEYVRSEYSYDKIVNHITTN